MEKFNELNLKTKTLNALRNINFKKPTKTQAMVLPIALKNKNLACKGKTGSGKTHCFIIPIAEKINENDKSLQAVILLPTRELAIQTQQRVKEFFADYDLKITLLTGGFDTLKEMAKVNNSPQILIGTPEKIVDVAINNGLLNFATVKTFVIDEADMTLEMGFLNEVDRIAYLCKDSQMMVFSATIPAGIKQFIKKYFKSSLVIECDNDNSNSNIEHILYPLRNRDKNEVLINVLNNINPYICLIFCNTKNEVEKVYKYLTNNGVECEMIHGDLQSRERKANIKRALDGKYRFIVCSDIASRGIDIEGVSHVISLGFPANNLEFYTHRAGRAGRLNLTGQAITLFNSNEDKKAIEELEKQGIQFVVKEVKNGEWRELKEFNARAKRKPSKTNDELNAKIKRAVNQNKSKQVKPNHKKKVKQAVEQVKRKHRREVIQNDINKRIKERAIAKSKGENN